MLGDLHPDKALLKRFSIFRAEVLVRIQDALLSELTLQLDPINSWGGSIAGLSDWTSGSKG
jgi:hypothetical protein